MSETNEPTKEPLVTGNFFAPDPAYEDRRDRNARAAMQGLLASPHPVPEFLQAELDQLKTRETQRDRFGEWAAKTSYLIADAMEQARKGDQ